jgi:SmpA / OmlA family
MLGSLAAVALFSPSLAHAQESEVAALRREVDRLRVLLLEVDARLRNIERPRADSPPQGDPPAPAASISLTRPFSYPEEWLRIAQGMTQEEVRSLLGPPHKTFQIDGSPVWYYSYSGVAGSVFFDSTGHASSYQRPSTWRLW